MSKIFFVGYSKLRIYSCRKFKIIFTIKNKIAWKMKTFRVLFNIFYVFFYSVTPSARTVRVRSYLSEWPKWSFDLRSPSRNKIKHPKRSSSMRVAWKLPLWFGTIAIVPANTLLCNHNISFFLSGIFLWCRWDNSRFRFESTTWKMCWKNDFKI